MTPQQQLRLAFGLVLLAVLAWLPFEDTHLFWSLILAAAISVLLAVYWVIRFPAGFFALPVIGAVAGAITPVFAAGLLLVKIGLHGHSAPDFTWEQFLSLFYRIPAWILGGLLLGAGATLLRVASRRRRK